MIFKMLIENAIQVLNATGKTYVHGSIPLSSPLFLEEDCYFFRSSLLAKANSFP